MKQNGGSKPVGKENSSERPDIGAPVPADDRELFALSEILLEQNAEAYGELAK